MGDVSLRTNPPPPLEWIPFPPLVAAVLITNKSDESPGSSRMGVIGALVIFSISDISSIDHLDMREFVSGSPRYHLAIKGVREQFVVLEQSSGP